MCMQPVSDVHATSEWSKAHLPLCGGCETAWNYEKFLVDGRGHVASRFASATPRLHLGYISAIYRTVLDVHVPAPDGRLASC